MSEWLFTAGLCTVLIGFLQAGGVQVPETRQPRIGFKPDSFGPPLWRSLHMAALNLPSKYSVSAVRAFEAYLMATAKILPCKSCRDDFKDILQRVNVSQFLRYGRCGAIALMYVLHALVSIKLNKPVPKIFVEEEELLHKYTLNVLPEKIGAVLNQLQSEHDAAGLNSLIADYL